MKKVISKEELKEKMNYAINLLCDTVKTTLGPAGNNIIIDHSTFSPFITNDGVTIAQNIESEDEVINTILELAKESSIKTNETVGDGTTTTLVFLQSIFNDGINYIDKGLNPIRLKMDLSSSVKKVIEEIKKYSSKPSNEELINIAKISSNDLHIGEIVGNTFLKTKNKNAIKIIEGDIDKVEYLDGYRIETSVASNLFFSDNKEINYNSGYILIINRVLDDINEIGEVINKIIEEKENLIIIGEYLDSFVNQILSLNTEIESNIVLLNCIEYGNKKTSILKDICAITNSKIVNNTINMDYIGRIQNIKIDKETTTFAFSKNSRIIDRINDIKNNEDIKDIEFANKRISMFESFLANIYVSAPTITERREKKMRYDDALCAVESANDGIILGSGITLLKIKENFKIDSIGDTIISNALEKPFHQIMVNSGINAKDVYEEIKNSDFNKVYNVNTMELETNTSVIDSANVVINALINATSIASMLLTTTSLVINEYQNNMCKTNEYTEL